MIGSWIVYGLVIGGLVAVAAWALERTCRIAGRPVRWVWAGALGLVVLLVGLAPHRLAPPPPSIRPALSAPIVPMTDIPDHQIRNGTPQRNGVTESLQTIYQSGVSAAQQSIAVVGQHLPERLGRYFAALWISLSGALFLLFGLVTFHFWRARRHWPVLELDGTQVRVSPQSGPAVVGVVHPAIVIPRWLLHRSREEQHLVVVHEQEHVRARDPLLLTVACLLTALLPWHPAMWWMLSRLRLAVELDCDARVLRGGTARRTYGALLIDLAGQCSRFPLGAPALAATSSHLEQRLLAMKPVHLPFAVARGGALGVFACFVLFLACEAQVPSPTDSATPTPQTQERVQLRGIGSVTKGNAPIVIVDGVQLTSGRDTSDSGSPLDRIDPDIIQNIEILKGDSAAKLYGPDAANGVIVITTKKDVDTANPARRDSTAPADGAPSPRWTRTRGNAVTTIRADSVLQAAPIRDLTALRTDSSGKRTRIRGNATTTIQADSVLQAAPTRTLTTLLEDRVPGVTVTDTSKDSARLRLRGLGSVTRNTEQMVVIDGVIASSDSGSPMDRIDPNIIHKIEVFKGPSAVTLYGPAAANGVIVITTKKDRPE